MTSLSVSDEISEEFDSGVATIIVFLDSTDHRVLQSRVRKHKCLAAFYTITSLVIISLKEISSQALSTPNPCAVYAQVGRVGS